MSLSRLLYLFQHVCHMAQTTNSSYCGNDRIPCTFCSFRGQTMKVFFLFFFFQGKMLPAPYCYLGIFGALQVNLTWVMLLFKYSRSLAKKTKQNPTAKPTASKRIESKEHFKELKKHKNVFSDFRSLFCACMSLPVIQFPCFSDLSPVKAVDRGEAHRAQTPSPRRSSARHGGKGAFYCF